MKKTHKKFVNITLLTAFLFCLLIPVFSACNNSTMADAAYRENAVLEFAILSDIHYTSPTLMDEKTAENFPEKFMDTKSFVSSNAILKSALDKIVESGLKYILIPGDLCDRQDLVSHSECADILKQAQERGVQIFVAPGNHDVTHEEGYEGYSYLKSSAAPVRVPDFYNPVLGEPRDESITVESQFIENYFEFGYSQALAVKGLNYTAELGEKHRLIVLDNCSVDLELETIDWAEQQVESAVKDGKTPIAMMHKPIHNMFGTILNLTDSAMTAKGKQLMNRLSEAGLKFVLTGHNHANNVAELKTTDENGNEVVAMYDIMTSSLIHTDHSYRVLRFSENYVVSKMLMLNEVNAEYLPSYMSEAERNKILGDLKNYSYDYLKDYVEYMITSDMVKDSLAEAMYGKDVAAPQEFDEFVENAIVDFATKPFYKSADGTDSVEALYEKYGAKLPKSKFYNLVDLAAATLTQIFEGKKDRAQNASLTTMLGASIKGLIVSAIDNGFFSLPNTVFEPVSKEVLDATCTRLLNYGELELLQSKILHNLLQLPLVDKVNELLGGFVSIPTDAETQETFGSVIGLLTFAEIVVDMEIEPYFESESLIDQTTGEERKIYSGVFYSDKCLKEQLFEGFAQSLVHDSDVPDRNFVMDLRNFDYERLN